MVPSSISPQLMAARPPQPNALDGAESSSEKGTLVHLALQHCDLATGKVPEAILARAGAERDWVTKIVQRFLDAPEGHAVRQLAPEHVLREARFRVSLSGTTGTALVGVVDLAFAGPGGWTIVEYKTGAARQEVRSMHRDQVAVYAMGLTHDHALAVGSAVVAYLTEPESTWVRFTPQPSAIALDELMPMAAACAAGKFPAQPARHRCEACPYGGRNGVCPECYKTQSNE